MNTYIPYQSCPKCNGQGTVSKPPHLAGDITQWTSSETSYTCDVCNGAKIILMHQIETEDGCPYFVSSNTAMSCDNCGKHKSKHYDT